MDSPCIKQTVCKLLKIFQYGKYLVAYVLNLDSGLIKVQTVCKGYQQATLVGKELNEEKRKYIVILG